jgi:antitoxin ParD1/3/4
MNVTLKPAFEEYVRRKVESGDFRSADEVVSEGLRLLQQQEEHSLAEARSKIDEGWDQAKSGALRGPDEVRASLTARKAAWKAKQSPS